MAHLNLICCKIIFFSRSKDIVEPLIKLQWFMDCKEAAKKAVEAVKNGDLRLVPDLHCKTW